MGEEHHQRNRGEGKKVAHQLKKRSHPQLMDCHDRNAARIDKQTLACVERLYVT
jgi:hypothetical protein